MPFTRELVLPMRGLAIVVLVGACSFEHGSLNAEQADASVVDAIDAMIDAALPATCGNGQMDGDETDRDCGGSCVPCPLTKMCLVSTDCLGAVCGTNNTCRRPASCGELHLAQPALGDGAYSLSLTQGNGGSAAETTFCDMTTDGGGWTLVGKVDGRFDMYNSWLVANINTSSLSTSAIGSNGAACLDAVALAVNRSTEIRFSNSARDRWVKWPLPTGRALTTFWHHGVGQTTINNVSQPAVTVTAWDGTTGTCYQNEYGISPFNMHGGSYPGTARDVEGRTLGSDLCMMIGTQTDTNTVDGFGQNGNGFDAPIDETTWPNTAYNVTPHVAVYLR
ncbi:MAG TPA: fibrinogen-like YCDxxxxGGGW domain-containing protein [Kofleriaceae bacterium]|nr:fibrinogen-like YCDxxxxGGGW domain-containing protein [Kofleriaceae bacterium]